MRKYTVLKEISLSDRHMPTGATRHYDGVRELPIPGLLKIVQYSPNEGFYVLRFDKSGNELTDTWHESLQHAVSQIKREYQVEPDEWDTF